MNFWRVFYWQKGGVFMADCPICEGELDEEGVCQDCGFDTTDKEESEEEDDDWGED